MGYCLWEPRRLKNQEQDCQRLKKAKGTEQPLKYTPYRAKRRHVICDYSHRLAKLHCPWDDDAKKKRNEISPGKLYHGLHSTDVTERLGIKPPPHASNPANADAPIEWHGRQSCDVTALCTYASRGVRPPSRDYYHGREATDISEFLRIIPPVAKPGNEADEFFGRPKSDVTNYNLFPTRLPETDPRFEALRPLGHCPPGPMCDFKPLIRDKEGKLLRPQPELDPSDVCSSGTHELPLSTTLPVCRQHIELPEGQEQQFVPGAGGILSQIVPGISRSESKKPVGRGIRGIMADYIQLERDDTGRVTNEPDIAHWDSPRTRSLQNSPRASCINEEHDHPPNLADLPPLYANRDEMKKPLGRAPTGPMHDFAPLPPRNKNRHTHLGYWAIPAAYPATPPGPEPQAPRDKESGQGSTPPNSVAGSSSKADKTLKDAKKKLKKDRRRGAVCQMHEPDCPYSAEQSHLGPCSSHPVVASYEKWPKDGDGEVGPCKKHGGRTGIFTVRGSPCSSGSGGNRFANRGEGREGGIEGEEGGTKGDEGGPGNAGPLPPGQPEAAARSTHGRPKSPKGFMGMADSLANQSPHRADVACPRAPCECIRVANKGTGHPTRGYSETFSRLDPKYGQRKTRPVSIAYAAAAAAASTERARTKGRPRRSAAFVTEETSPQHFQGPYFGLAGTYVTNPAISPNQTPPLQKLRKGGEKDTDDKAKNESRALARRGGIFSGGGESLPPAALLTKDDMPKSCSQADVCKHHHDGKSPWYGKSKTFVTDPAVSPNLTPPCFQTQVYREGTKM